MMLSSPAFTASALIPPDVVLCMACVTLSPNSAKSAGAAKSLDTARFLRVPESSLFKASIFATMDAGTPDLTFLDSGSTSAAAPRFAEPFAFASASLASSLSFINLAITRHAASC